MGAVKVQFCDSKKFPLSLLAVVEQVLTKMGTVVRFRGSKGFPTLLLVEVLMEVVETAQFRDSKEFPLLHLVEVE